MARGQLPSLPQEIMVEIFSRLPAKSIGQFRCVSKPWRVLLSDPQFIKKHLNNHRTEDNLILIFHYPNLSIHTITDIGDDNLSRTIRFRPELPNSWTRVTGSCNGLVLLVNGLLDHEMDLFLVNPTTSSQVKIPNLPGKSVDFFVVYGLGYDASSDDYKIIAITDRDLEDELECVDKFLLTYSFAYMYSMKRGIWKRLEGIPYYHDNELPYDNEGGWPGAFVSGSLHWWAYTRDDSCLIATFDLVDEKFKEIPGPGCLNRDQAFYDIIVLKGCLCMFDKQNSTPDQVDIWIMKEYGVKESWVKLSVTTKDDWGMVKPLCFIGDDKIVLEIKGYRLIVYKFKTGTSRAFMVDRIPAIFGERGTFVDSLVWPSDQVIAI